MSSLIKLTNTYWCSHIFRQEFILSKYSVVKTFLSSNNVCELSTSTKVNMMKRKPNHSRPPLLQIGGKLKHKWQIFLRKRDGFPTSAQAKKY